MIDWRGDERVLDAAADKTEVLDGDATAMKFADSVFDVLVSNLVIHNIPSREERDKACREIARVLKPGGVTVISDFVKTKEYQAEFVKAGMHISGTKWSWGTFPPLRVIVARKKSSTARRSRENR